jgi:hypothetical protein
MTVSLYQQWLNAKQIEAAAIKTRRDIEDQLVKQFDIPENLEGTKNIEAEMFRIKIEGRINRKVNADKLQELAAEHGLTDHLSSLFRWKPEINMTLWKAADAAITTPLLDAITATPGRPSFTIIKAGE